MDRPALTAGECRTAHRAPRRRSARPRSRSGPPSPGPRGPADLRPWPALPSPVSRRRRAVAGLDLELDLEGVAVRRVDGFGRLDRAAVGLDDDPRSTSSGLPWRVPSRRASSAVAATAEIVPVPRDRLNPARPSASWSEPFARSAAMTASAEAPIRMAVSTAMGSPSASRSRRRWTTGWWAGIPRLAASAVEDGRMTRIRTRELGRRPARSISWLNVMRRLARRCAGGSATKLPASRLPPDQAILGEALHGVPRRHPADPELGAQLGVGRQPLAGPQRRDPLAQNPLDLAVLRLVGRSRSSRTGGRDRGSGVPLRRLRAVDGRPDRSRPRPELGRHDLDLVEGGCPDAPPQLVRGSGPATDRRRRQIPPPITIRSGETTVTMFAMPIPR